MRSLKAWRGLAPLILLSIAGLAHAKPIVTVFTATAETGAPARLVSGPDGTLYFGSDKGVFRLTSGSAALIASLPAAPDQLIAGHDGNFYGTVAGTTFRLRPDGAVTTLAPLALKSLLLATDGNLYGSKADGVYRLTTSGSLAKLTGAYNGNVIEGPGGLLFGVTAIVEIEPPYYFYGWTNHVYEITRAGVVTETDSFGCGNGWADVRLTATPAGTLFGVSRGEPPFSDGDCYGEGGVYSIDSQGQYTQLQSFQGYDGSALPLLHAVDGTLFGITFGCWSYGDVCAGTRLFRFRPPAKANGKGEIIFIDHVDDREGLTQTADGTIYGIDHSTIYRVKRPTTLVGQGTFSVSLTGAITLNPKVTLTDDMLARGVAGQTIKFWRKGALLCTAKTDASGAATCKIPAKDHDGGFDATFGETDLYAGNAIHSPLLCIGATCPAPLK